MVRAQAKGHDTHEHPDHSYRLWVYLLVGWVGGWLIFFPHSNVKVVYRADEFALCLEKTG